MNSKTRWFGKILIYLTCIWGILFLINCLFIYVLGIEIHKSLFDDSPVYDPLYYTFTIVTGIMALITPFIALANEDSGIQEYNFSKMKFRFLTVIAWIVGNIFMGLTYMFAGSIIVGIDALALSFLGASILSLLPAIIYIIGCIKKR